VGGFCLEGVVVDYEGLWDSDVAREGRGIFEGAYK